MGLLDDLKGKAEGLGEKAKDGLDAARGRAAGLVGDVKDRTSELVDDVKDRVGGEADAPADKVAEAADNSAGSVQETAEKVKLAAAEREVPADPAGTPEDRYDEVLEAAQARSEELKAQP